VVHNGRMNERTGQTSVMLNDHNLTPAETLRLHRLGRELRLTDQILSVDLDSLAVVDHGPAPAWTTLEGDRIMFAMDKMPMPTSRADVAVWLGTNAHELGHCLFSPRRGSMLMQRVMQAEQVHLRGIADLHNICEDQRQERLLLARFAPWQTYLTAALGYHLSTDTDAGFVLVAGRTWLPAAVRDQARARFAATFGAWSAQQVAEIVGDYQRLTDPGDSESDEAWDLLERLHELFGTHIPHLPTKCRPIEGGEPDTSDASAACPPAADEDSEDEDSEDEDSEDSEDSEDEPGAGSLAKQISRAAAGQIAQDTDAELDSMLDVLQSGRGAGDEVDGREPVGSYQPLTDTARRLHHEIADALVELKDDAEPGWDKRTDSGRLNVRRLLNPLADADQLFDRYEPGHLDSTELELVLLVDVSGSMHSQMFSLAEATWAIRHAMDDLEGTATVLAFEAGQHRVLAGPGDRPDDRLFVSHPGGGTNPHSALIEAYRLLSESTRRHRLAVILTDGSWSQNEQSEQVIRAMNEAGMITVCALLGPVAGPSFHECSHGDRIDDPSGLARLFARVAAEQMGCDPVIRGRGAP
jgi:hypothetical protein